MSNEAIDAIAIIVSIILTVTVATWILMAVSAETRRPVNERIKVDYIECVATASSNKLAPDTCAAMLKALGQ